MSRIENARCRIVRIFSVLVVLMALFSGCAQLPKKKELTVATETARQEFLRVTSDFSRKPTPSSLKLMKGLTAKYPNTDLSSEVYALLGEHYYKNKMYQEALTTFDGILSSEFQSPKENFALYGSVKALFHLNRFRELNVLSLRALTKADFPPAYQAEVLRLRCQGLKQEGLKNDELLCLNRQQKMESDPAMLTSVKQRSNELVEYELDEESLRKIVDSDFPPPLRAYAAFRVGSFLYERGETSDAEGFLSRAIQLNGQEISPFLDRANTLLQQIQARNKQDKRAIGAVLPLSGRHGQFGQRTLRGLLLGLGIYGNPRTELKLNVIDSEGNADRARRGVEELVLKDNVVAIVGSLLSKTALSVASKGQEYLVPTIGLSQRADLTEVGNFVFRNSVTSAMLVKKLVDVAMGPYGFKRFAILYPNDPYGVEYANLFWDEVRARGGSIVGAQTYKTDETDFSGPIQRLVGTYYLEDRQEEYSLMLKEWVKKQKSISKRASAPTELLPPVVDFDAIFIPDGVKALGQIAPSLVFNDVKNVTLLGTNLWSSSSLVERGQKSVEGAIFVDGDSLSSPDFKVSPFFKQYLAAFGEEPGIFEYQGYETGILLRQAMSQGGSDRKSLQRALERISGFQSFGGRLKMLPSRELERSVQAFTVKNGAIIQLE